MARLNVPDIIRTRRFWLVAGLAAVLLIAAAVWWFSAERLPGYNIEPTNKPSYVEPGGTTSEFITGYVTKNEFTIIGWQVTLKMDENSSTRIFRVPAKTPVWLGLIIGGKSITGRQRVEVKEIKAGQRVAVFFDEERIPRRINILVR